MVMRPSASDILKLQFLLLAGLVAGISVLDRSTASRYFLYEFMGVVSASMLTVFGLHRMKEMT
ncbi:MAG: hypothetical protein ABEJ98_02585 [Candidatus Nanohaloarchaea archaeon]